MVPYANVDLIYGWKAFNENDGFTNAQCEWTATYTETPRRLWFSALWTLCS